MSFSEDTEPQFPCWYLSSTSSVGGSSDAMALLQCQSDVRWVWVQYWV